MFAIRRESGLSRPWVNAGRHSHASGFHYPELNMGTAVSLVNGPDGRRRTDGHRRWTNGHRRTFPSCNKKLFNAEKHMHRRKAGTRTASVAVIVALAACISTANRGNPMVAGAEPSPVLSEGPRALYIGRAELTNAGLETMADVVVRLRPDWLRWNPTLRGMTGEPARASVYTDGNYSGETDVLRTIPPEVVVDARYLPPVEARNRFGSACHCAGGVILVRTRTDRD